MTNQCNQKDGWDKLKICGELLAIVGSSLVFLWGVHTYYHNLKVDKTQLLYKDFIMKGTVPLISKVSNIAHAHLGPENPMGLRRYQTIVGRLPAGGIKFKDLKKKYPDTTLYVDPLTSAEKEQIKKASREAIDLLNSKLFFLDSEIILALRCSINLLRDETPSRASPNIYFSLPKIGQEDEKKHIRLADAYRYKIFINTNYRFLREPLQSIPDYILKKNIHTYKEMTELFKLPDKNSSEEITVIIKNLKEFKRRYMAYLNWWKGMPGADCLSENTELLISFFEDYIDQGERRLPIEPLREGSLCGEKPKT